MEDNHWHIDKRITIGHLITTVTVAVSVILYVTAVEKRVALLESKFDMTQTASREQERRMDKQFDKVLSAIEGLSIKIDQKQDKTR
jgi:hypothetical protein